MRAGGMTGWIAGVPHADGPGAGPGPGPGASVDDSGASVVRPGGSDIFIN